MSTSETVTSMFQRKHWVRGTLKSGIRHALGRYRNLLFSICLKRIRTLIFIIIRGNSLKNIVVSQLSCCWNKG